MIGGLTVDMNGATTLPGLWAAGEVTSSGLHGANRLASNSLLEGLVFGGRAGKGASEAAGKIGDDFHARPLQHDAVPQNGEPLDLVDIRNSLKSLMWRSAGVRRDEKGLRQALGSIEDWCKYVLQSQFGDPEGWELQNMLIVSHAIIRSAVARKESRGVHLRTDFPDREESWNRHQTFVNKDAEVL